MMRIQPNDAPRRPNAGGHGFTLVELLLALSIVGVVVALTVPAIQSAREKSRLIQCANRMRMFGTALHGYATTRDRFPPGAVEAKNGRPHHQSPIVSARERVVELSPHVLLLPYLEQSAIHDQLTAAGPVGFQWNPGLVSTPPEPVLPVFLCPSDPVARGTNIRVCTGIGPGFFDNREKRVPPKGAFTDAAGHGFAAFKDGLSNTVAASERIIADDNTARFSPREDYWFSGIYTLTRRLPTPDQMQAICELQGTVPPTWYPRTGQSWRFCGYDYTWYNHVAPPNSQTPDCTINSLPSMPSSDSPNARHVISTAGSHKASSYHSGGVNVLMMDGSVIFRSNQVDLTIWRAMATRASGETVSDL